MKNPGIILIFVVVLLIVSLAGYYYIFNIYETVIETSSKSLFADGHSTITITVVPVNALGWKVPFRNVSSNFEIREGRDLVNILYEDKNSGKLILQAKHRTGTISIYVKSKYSLLPSLVEINIVPNFA